MKDKTKQILKLGYKLTEIGEIPEEWEVVRLGDKNERVAEIIMCQSPPSSTYNDRGVGLPFLQGKAEFGEIYPTLKIYTSRPTKIAERRDILISVRAPVGEVNLTPSKCCIGRGLSAIRPKPSKLDYKFAFYYSKQANHQLLAMATGSTFGAVKKEDLISFLIPLPPLPEQQKIAEILSTVDEAIQKSDEIIEKTRELKKGLMQQLLTRGISHTKFKQTEIGEIPEEWKVVRLGEITEIIGGGTPSTRDSHYWNGNIPFVIPTDITNLRNNYLERTENYITEEGLKNSSAKLLPVGTVLLTSRATIGFCAINKIPVATNQGFASLICGERVLNSYILYSMRFITNKLESLASGSTFREVSKTTLKSLKLPLPPFLEQRKIAEILSTVDEKIEVERRRKEKLEELKKGLMQVLLTGKVRVTGSLESVES